MSWMLTRTGVEFDLLNPSPKMVNASDIAYALPRLCRFVGHTNRFYSVGEHSWIGSQKFEDPLLRLEFLLHDASEAYIGDISKPLKSIVPEIKRIESRIDAVVRMRFGLPVACSPLIKEMDLRMLATERRFLMPEGSEWDCLDGVISFDELPEYDPKNIEMWMLFGIDQLTSEINR